MKNRRSAEQIVGLLRQTDEDLGKGSTVPDVCRRLGISQQVYYWWRTKFGHPDAGPGRGRTRRGLFLDWFLPKHPLGERGEILPPGHRMLNGSFSEPSLRQTCTCSDAAEG
jgi:hypothetical protein